MMAASTAVDDSGADGTMVEGDQLAASGCLYSIQARRVVRCHVWDVRVSNGHFVL